MSDPLDPAREGAAPLDEAMAQAARGWLRGLFAPWVQALNLQLERISPSRRCCACRSILPCAARAARSAGRR
jgi:hypothetical protein